MSITSLEDVVDGLFKEIEHGDEEHRAWLKEALLSSKTLMSHFRHKTDMTMYSFSEALDLIRLGKRVTRASWKDSNVYLFLTKGQFDGPYLGFSGDSQPDVNHQSTIDSIRLGLFENKGAHTPIKYPKLSMMMASGCVLEGWTPNQLDTFASDYILV